MKTLDESRFRELVERHVEDRLSDDEARELLGAVEADAVLRRRAADEAAFATVLAGVLRPRPIDIAPRVLAALRNDAEKTTLLRRVMERLPDRCPAPVDGRARAVLVRRGLLAAAAAVLVAFAAATAYRAIRPATPVGGSGAPLVVSRPPRERVAPEDRLETRSTEPRRAVSATSPSDSARWGRDFDPNPIEPEPAVEPRHAPATSPAPSTERPPEEPRRTHVALEPDEPRPPVATAEPAPSRERLVVAHLDAMNGGVTIESAGSRLPASKGMPFRAHDVLRTPAKASAALRYDDGTRLGVSGESVLVLSPTVTTAGGPAVAVVADPGKRVSLERGLIEADVVAQPAELPMVFVTPVADVVVACAQIDLWASPESTRVEIRSGAGRISRRSDGASIAIRAGQLVVAVPGQPLAARFVSKPVLACAVYPARGDVDIDREGSLDWVFWTWNETVQTIRRREPAPEAKVGPLSVFNAATLGGWAQSPLRLSWADGRPTPRGASVSGGVRIPGLSNGFQFTLPADRVAKTLRLYVGVASGQGRLEAVLRDGSAPPVDDTSVSAAAGEILYSVYSIRYAAASEGQTLTVRWTMMPGAGRREARDPEGGRVPERDALRRDDPFSVLQAVTVSEALLEESDRKKERRD